MKTRTVNEIIILTSKHNSRVEKTIDRTIFTVRARTCVYINVYYNKYTTRAAYVMLLLRVL